MPTRNRCCLPRVAALGWSTRRQPSSISSRQLSRLAAWLGRFFRLSVVCGLGWSTGGARVVLCGDTAYSLFDEHGIRMRKWAFLLCDGETGPSTLITLLRSWRERFTPPSVPPSPGPILLLGTRVVQYKHLYMLNLVFGRSFVR